MATRTISNAGGNFSAVGAWVEGIVPVAGDAIVATATSGSLVVDVPSAAASMILTGYVGTLTFNSTLTLTSTCTFVAGMTIAGTAGALIMNGASTMTSGGKTLTCKLTFLLDLQIYTLADNWTVNGLVTLERSTYNGNQITCNGGLNYVNATAGGGGTTKMVIAGGSWTASAGGSTGVNIDLAGNVTVSGTVGYRTGTLRRVSGTITTTGSTLVLDGAATLDVAGMTWNNVTFNNAGLTYTLASAFAWSGTMSITPASVTFAGSGALTGTGSVTISVASTITLNNTGGLTTTGTLTLPDAAVTFAGTAGFTVGTLTTATLTGSRVHTLTFGNVYVVSSALANVGTSPTVRQALKSSSAGNKVTFKVTPGATEALAYCDPTDVDSSSGAQVVSINGTITNSLNWVGSVTAGGGGGGGGGGRVFHMGL